MTRLAVVYLLSLLSVLSAFGCGGTTADSENASDSDRAESSQTEEHATDPGPDTTFFPTFARRPFTGDLDAMRERRFVRVLVTLSRTDFFLTRGRPRGLQADLAFEFEEMLNRGVSRSELQTRVVFVPVRFDDLIPALLEGRGDVAAALLTVTPEREEQVDIITPGKTGVAEVVVRNRTSPPVTRMEELGGREVYVLRSSSYAEHLRKWNRVFEYRGLEPIRIVEADPNLLTEDILELVNAGIVSYTVCDDYKANLWVQALPDLSAEPEVLVRDHSTVGWAIRENSPELKQALTEFATKVSRGSYLGNTLLDRYLVNTKWVKNPSLEEERAKLSSFASLFRRYGEQYGFDWLALAAQGYQESGLDHSARSHVGAVGVMQVLPSTAADPIVGIKDISTPENNIHAAVKYLAYLREEYFAEPQLTEEDRLAFIWAAYNAGPNRVRRLRGQTEDAGLDPDRWFGNVEHIVMRRVGREPVQYVANIYKYYVAYKLSQYLEEQKKQGAAERG